MRLATGICPFETPQVQDGISSPVKLYSVHHSCRTLHWILWYDFDFTHL